MIQIRVEFSLLNLLIFLNVFWSFESVFGVRHKIVPRFRGLKDEVRVDGRWAICESWGVAGVERLPPSIGKIVAIKWVPRYEPATVLGCRAGSPAHGAKRRVMVYVSSFCHSGQ